MSPIVVTNSSPAGRIKRVKAASSGATPFFEENFTGGVAKTTNDGSFYWASPSYTAVSPYLGQDRGISSERAYSGTHSMKWTFGPDADPSTGQQNSAWYFTMNRNLTDVWIERQLWVSANFAHRLNSPGTNNNKFMELYRDGAGGGSPNNCILVEQFSLNNVGGDQLSKTKTGATTWDSLNSLNYPFSDIAMIGPTGPLIPGEWNRIRTRFKPASSNSASDGAYYFAINDTVLLNVTNAKIWNRSTSPNWATDCYVNGGYMLGACNSGYTEATTFYMDAFKFYDTNPGW